MVWVVSAGEKIEPVGASHCVGGNEILQAVNEYSIDAVKRGLGPKSDCNLMCAELVEVAGKKYFFRLRINGS